MDVNDIIKNNTGLIYRLLNKFYLRDDPDAESAAYWALYKAATSYDKDNGTAFSTYATCCIYNALGDHIRHLKRKQQLDLVYYNAVAYADDNGDHEHLEFIPDSKRTDDSIMSEELMEILHKSIEKVLSTTTGKSRLIVDTWLDSDMQLQTIEIAKMLNISQCYVSQSLATFKHRLKLRMEDYIKW